MLFPTVDFALFFVVVFAISWWLSRRHQKRHIFLLAASYFFYGYWDWRLCTLMFIASVTAWAAGVLLQSEERENVRTAIAILACGMLLGVLGYFKYYGFFIQTILPLLEQMGLERDRFLLEIILPIGISFFTF